MVSMIQSQAILSKWRMVSMLLVSLSMETGCRSINPAFYEDRIAEAQTEAETGSVETDEDASTFSGAVAGTTEEGGAKGTSQTLPASVTTTSADQSSESEPIQSHATSSAPEASSSDSVTEEPKPRSSYCSKGEHFCLEMNNPDDAGASPDPLKFDVGSHAVFEGEADREDVTKSWIKLDGTKGAVSAEAIEIPGLTGSTRDTLGFDIWVWYANNGKGSVFFELEGSLAIGKGNKEDSRCSAFREDQGLTTQYKWKISEVQSSKADQWQHFACYFKSGGLRSWNNGQSYDISKPIDILDVHFYSLNKKTTGKLFLADSPFLRFKRHQELPYFNGKIAGLRIWTDVDKMLEVLNAEHQQAIANAD